MISSEEDWNNTHQLMNLLRDNLGTESLARYSSACASEVLVGNLVRRVLKLIREEHASAVKGGFVEQSEEESLHKLVVSKENEEDEAFFSKSSPDLRSKILEALAELSMELETAAEEISNQVMKYL